MMDTMLLLPAVLLPLVFGAALLCLPDSFRHCRSFSFLGACATSAAVLALLPGTRHETVTVLRFAWDFSIAFRLDGLAALFAGMLALMWPMALLYACEYMHGPCPKRFFAFYLMTYGIALGVALSANLTTLYVFFELLTLITLPLVAHYQNPESLRAARMYVIYCVAGAALGFIPVVLGTLDGGGWFRYGGALSGRLSPADLGAG